MAAGQEDFDVIVVGGRCAGAPLAQLLAGDGLRGCVMDRDRFPSDTPSTHGIQPAGAQILERLGVLARLPSAARVRHGRAAFDDVRPHLRDATDALGGPMLNVRRVTLDAALLGAAAAAGAEVRTGCAVTGLHREAGRVVGVDTREGRLRARLVVGADGARSMVARQLGAAEYHVTEAGRVFLWAFYEGAQAPEATVWLGKIGDHAYLASPTDSGLFMAAVAP